MVVEIELADLLAASRHWAGNLGSLVMSWGIGERKWSLGGCQKKFENFRPAGTKKIR